MRREDEEATRIAQQICGKEHVHGLGCLTEWDYPLPMMGTVAELEQRARDRESEKHDSARVNSSRSGEEPREGEPCGVGLLPAQPIALIPHRPDPEIRAILERALADYDSGKLTGLAVIKLFADTDGCESDWHGKRWELLTGATRIAHRMQRALDEITDDRED